nr:uncharacterized protein LOC112717674 [Arachis hypogaea]
MTAWDMPGKYLGLPAIWGRPQNRALTWIEEKITSKMDGWKEKLLNQAGKETLIKTVIQAMPSYAMNIIKLPKSFCRRICSKVARFWWATSGKEWGIHWRKWDCITESKNNGGLGFKDLEKHNTAYLAKQAWRAMKNPDAIWVQVLKSMYFPDENFWTAKCKKGASWVWKSILHGRELLRERAKWSIRDGSKVSIWKDNWITGRSKPLDANSPDDSKEVNPSWTISRARTLETVYGKLAEKQQTQKREANRSRTYPVTWRPPPENWLKANVDAAFRKENETGAIAVVIRNSKGKMVLGFSGKIQAKSSTVAEAQAIRKALIIVNNLNMGKTLIESNNLMLIQTIKSKPTIGEASAIIQDIQILMKELPEKGMTWTPRNGNRLAHVVAKAAESKTLHSTWSLQPPAEIRRILRSEIRT